MRKSYGWNRNPILLSWEFGRIIQKLLPCFYQFWLCSFSPLSLSNFRLIKLPDLLIYVTISYSRFSLFSPTSILRSLYFRWIELLKLPICGSKLPYLIATSFFFFFHLIPSLLHFSLFKVLIFLLSKFSGKIRPFQPSLIVCTVSSQLQLVTGSASF